MDVLERELEYHKTEARRVMDIWRTEHAFLTGKIERLELATFKHGNEIAREYAARAPIIEVPVEQPKEPTRKNWKQVQEEWASMTDEQKEAAIAKGAN